MIADWRILDHLDTYSTVGRNKQNFGVQESCLCSSFLLLEVYNISEDGQLLKRNVVDSG